MTLYFLEVQHVYIHIGFYYKKQKILMINRHKHPWKGCWNGLGGKIKPAELPIDSLIRELHEEMGLHFDYSQIKDCGYLTWNSFDANGQGLYLYLINMHETQHVLTPVATDEGILDWKDVDWIIDPHNLGVSHNIRYFLSDMLNSNDRYHYHCVFKGDVLLNVERKKIT